MKNKVLITGASGLLGANLLEYLSPSYKLYGSYFQHKIENENIQTFKLNIRNKEKVTRWIKEIRPDYVIHTAALTEVDACEDNRNLAYQVNVQGTENILSATADIGAHLTYISTDAVFGGKKGDYNEKDAPNPVNYYGQTKLQAEGPIKSYDRGLVLRINLYGWNAQSKLSLAEWIIRNLKQKKKLTLFKDVTFNPLYVQTIAKVIQILLEKNQTGLFHVGASDIMSKLEFGRKIGKIFSLQQNTINPTSVEEKDFLATRPKNTTLCVSRIEGTLSKSMPKIAEGIEKMKSDTPLKEKLTHYME